MSELSFADVTHSSSFFSDMMEMEDGFAKSSEEDETCDQGSPCAVTCEKYDDIDAVPRAPSNSKIMLEVFAGCANLTKAFRRRGFLAIPIDIGLNPNHDMRRNEFVETIITSLGHGAIRYVHSGNPCSTFSRARYPHLRWP